MFSLGYGERLDAARKSLEKVYYPLVASKKRYISFWAGDFNFRKIGGSDQMDQARTEGHFDQFQEQPINFPPTCKMKTDGTCDRPTSDSSKVPGCYNMKRAPSHCDRVLYESSNVQLIPRAYKAYGDAPAIQASDHNLVYADFWVYLK